eukprot:3334153-Lingulodinium_polyedra.AAC.1
MQRGRRGVAEGRNLDAERSRTYRRGVAKKVVTGSRTGSQRGGIWGRRKSWMGSAEGSQLGL